VKLYFGACFFKSAGVHGRAKVRSGEVPSKIQHCIPAWTDIALYFFLRRTGIVLFFERRVLRAGVCFE